LVPIITGLFGAVTGVLVPVGIWWFELRPTDASLTMREGSFEIVSSFSAQDDPLKKKRPHSWSEVVAAVVYEKKGDGEAGNCVLQPKYPQGSTFQANQLVVDAMASLSHTRLSKRLFGKSCRYGRMEMH
jgi:hypothetical protein